MPLAQNQRGKSWSGFHAVIYLFIQDEMGDSIEHVLSIPILSEQVGEDNFMHLSLEWRSLKGRKGSDRK